MAVNPRKCALSGRNPPICLRNRLVGDASQADSDHQSDAEPIVREFRTRFYDTKLFHDKYAGGKFAQYLFRRHEDKVRTFDEDTTRRLFEETQLFIEASYACNGRIMEQSATAQAIGNGKPALAARG